MNICPEHTITGSIVCVCQIVTVNIFTVDIYIKAFNVIIL